MSGGPTAVLNASLVGVIKTAGPTCSHILGSRRGIEGFIADDFVDLSSLSANRLEKLYRTPSASLQTSRKRPSEEEIDLVIERCRQHRISGIVAIGGNDTADTVRRIAARSDGPHIVEIPKTIDNDLPGTHYSLGYGSAAGFLAGAVRDATMDTIGTASLYPVKFFEVMGRNAGWLVAACSLGCTAALPEPLLCLPERPLASFDELAMQLEKRLNSDGFAVVVVPETLRWRDGQHVAGTVPEYVDPFGHSYFPSAGHALSRSVTEYFGLRARYDKPGTLMRAATGRGFEQEAAHAFQCGVAAVERLADGYSGVVLKLVPESVTSTSLSVGVEVMPVEQVANIERTMPDEMIAESGTNVTAVFHAYALPIMGGVDEQYTLL